MFGLAHPVLLLLFGIATAFKMQWFQEPDTKDHMLYAFVISGARHKRSHAVCFHLYEISNIDKSMEVESKLVGFSAWKEESGEWLPNGYGVLFQNDESVSELDRGSGYTILWKY